MFYRQHSSRSQQSQDRTIEFGSGPRAIGAAVIFPTSKFGFFEREPNSNQIHTATIQSVACSCALIQQNLVEHEQATLRIVAVRVWFGFGSRSNSNFRGWEWRDSGAACFSKLVRSDACCLLASPSAKDCVGTALTCLQIVTWTAMLLDLASESSRLSARWWWIGHGFNLISGPNSLCDPDRAFVSLCLPPSSAIAVFSCSWSPFVCIYSLPVGGSAKIDPPSERESCRRYNAACGAVDEEARG